MTKQLLGFVFSISLSAYSYAQDTSLIRYTTLIRQPLSTYIDSMRQGIASDTFKKRFFSPKAYDRFFDRYFTLFNFERSNFTEGNSAALSLKDSSTRLNLTLSHKIGSSIFSVGTKLAIADNSGVLFSGSKPTAGTEFFVSQSFLLRSQRLLKYNNDKRRQNYAARTFVLDSIESVYGKKNPNLILLLFQQKDTLRRKIDRLEASLAMAHDSAKYALRQALSEAYDEQTKNRDAFKGFEAYMDPAGLYTEVTKATGERSIEKELETKGVTSFRLKWISYGLTYRRDNYNTWDSALSLSTRAAEQAFNKWTASFAYNFAFQRTKEFMDFSSRLKLNSYYLGAVYSLTRSNNFADITEQEYAIRKQTTAADTLYQLTTTKKLRDVSGKKFDTYFDHQFSLQGTVLFGKKGFFGFNLRQDFLLGEHQPYYNSRIGTLFRFIDSKDEKSKVNFEIFLSLADLADYKGSGKSPWQRKEIGVSATVPFSTVFFQ